MLPHISHYAHINARDPACVAPARDDRHCATAVVFQAIPDTMMPTPRICPFRYRNPLRWRCKHPDLDILLDTGADTWPRLQRTVALPQHTALFPCRNMPDC